MYISVFQLLELCFGRQEKEGAVGKDLHRITKMNKKTQEVRKNFMKKKGTVRNRTVWNRTWEYENGCHYGKCRKFKISWFRLWNVYWVFHQKNLAKNIHGFIIF